jgi:hypothetical protein
MSIKPNSITYQWFSQKKGLSETKMQWNANNMYNYFCARKGWTKNALAGMLGNMESESTLNPAVLQNWIQNPFGRLAKINNPKIITNVYAKGSWDATFDAYFSTGTGFGLVQWTSPKKFFDFYLSAATTANLNAYQSIFDAIDVVNAIGTLDYYYADGGYVTQATQLKNSCYTYELDRIQWEMENNAQWDSSVYNMTFEEFAHSTDTAYNLGVKFLHAYERPAEYHDDVRGAQAEKWYNFLGGSNPGIVEPWMFAGKPIWMSGHKNTW